MPTKCPFAFAIDPVDPFVLFYGDDEWVKVSRDGGVTWTPAARAPQPDAEIAALAIDPSDRNTILAGTSDGRTFKTTNGGATWFYATDGPVAGEIDYLQFVGKSGDILFARQGSSILRSLDGGDHWQVLPSASEDNPFGVFAVDPFSTSTVYWGTRDGVMVTTDFGEHWARRHLGITRAMASVALHEDTSTTLHATTGRGLFTSRDSGDTWTASRQAGTPAGKNITSLTSDGASGVLARTASGVYALRRGDAAWVPFAGRPRSAGVHVAPRSRDLYTPPSLNEANNVAGRVATIARLCTAPPSGPPPGM